MLKVSEVYEKQVRRVKERPDGSDYVNFEKVFTSRDCLINPNYIVAVHPHEFSSDYDLRRIDACFPEGTKFSTFVLDGNSFRTSEITIVGSFDKFVRVLGESES